MFSDSVEIKAQLSAYTAYRDKFVLVHRHTHNHTHILRHSQLCMPVPVCCGALKRGAEKSH